MRGWREPNKRGRQGVTDGLPCHWLLGMSRPPGKAQLHPEQTQRTWQGDSGATEAHTVHPVCSPVSLPPSPSPSLQPHRLPSSSLKMPSTACFTALPPQLHCQNLPLQTSPCTSPTWLWSLPSPTIRERRHPMLSPCLLNSIFTLSDLISCVSSGFFSCPPS